MKHPSRIVPLLTCLATATIAADLALAGGFPSCGSPGNCYQQHGTPGCSNPTCCNIVCNVDSFCCEVVWDNVCVGEALDLCTTCGEAVAGSCYEVHGPGCNNLSCCDFVCEVDPFCCTTGWDDICVGEALDLCSSCGNANAGSCLQPHGPGCASNFCCESICEQDPSCCESAWDANCVDLAFLACTSCGFPGAGSCFAQHGSPSCENEVCCEAVCGFDPYCCETAWDGFCVAEANDFCATCGGSGAGSCYGADSTPTCSDADCCNLVCASDPFCCQSTWDQLCAEGAFYLCLGCGQEGAGDCWTEQKDGDAATCDSRSCCNIICDIDLFCCLVEWDAICVASVENYCCRADCVNSFNFSTPNDGDVNAADLAVLLGDWGPCADCCTDTVTTTTFAPPSDGNVDAADLAFLLGSWGTPCSIN